MCLRITFLYQSTSILAHIKDCCHFPSTVRCERVIFSCLLTLFCAWFRVQIGGDNNGAICVSAFIRSHKGIHGAGRLCAVVCLSGRWEYSAANYISHLLHQGKRHEGASNQNKMHVDAVKILFFRSTFYLCNYNILKIFQIDLEMYAQNRQVFCLF